MRFLCSCFFLFAFVVLLISGCGKDNPAPNVLKEDSLGTGWSKVPLANVIDLFFVDNNTGYAAGTAFYKSTNGGVTWSSLSLPANTGTIKNMFWLDANNGWLTGSDNDHKNFVLRTSDGGISFSKAALPGDERVSDVQFLNKRLGYIVLNNNLFMSVDSGKTWKVTASTFNEPAITLFFQDSTKGFIAGENTIFGTTNGGASFITQQSLAQRSMPYGMQFSDANTGWVPCTGGVYKTINAGANWELVPMAGPAVDVHFFNKDQGFLLQLGAILKTTDGGKHFSKVVSVVDASLAEIHFTDSKHGWVIKEGPNDSYILRYVEP
jgi:photosystem II stability/assembly factor-like uncharacterized protein